MKLISLVTAALALTLPALVMGIPASADDSERTVILRYAAEYGQPKHPSTGVACHRFLEDHDWHKLGQIPRFPYIAGVFTVKGPGFDKCGTCYEVTYHETHRSVYVLAVDTAGEGFNTSEDVLRKLTGGSSERPIEVEFKEAPPRDCGISH